MEGSGLISVEREQNWLRLVLSPNFGLLPSIDPFKNAIEHSLPEEEANLVLDLSRVEQLNSVALGALMWLYRRHAQLEEGKLVCVGVSDGVREILRFSRLDRLIPVVSEEELMSHFAKQDLPGAGLP